MPVFDTIENKIKIKRASLVTMQDRLIMFGKTVEITNILITINQGFYSPLTLSSYLMVNNVSTSVFSANYKVSSATVQLGFLPIRVYYHITRWMYGNNYNPFVEIQDGLHPIPHFYKQQQAKIRFIFLEFPIYLFSTIIILSLLYILFKNGQLNYDYDDQPDQSNSDEPTSLQDAIARTFNRFLDKSLTVNHWKCGIDLNLNTWRTKLFSRNRHDQNIEQQERNTMLQYAINNCTSVAELFFHMYPEKINNYSITPEPIKPTPSNIIIKINNDLSDISDDELPEICIPRFNNKQQTTHQSHELIITATQQEMNEIILTTQPE
ncbi:unnamed protein product [Adineta steineri]|uniref:Hedgehog protein Hint domain-containing protein n=1 Tax=Adineta steineri TaxID=433720 RepID=A0A814MC65_9BILA|nr:unnamed protein product [Adineta steineri]CAF1077234.1 unnamed protein product [Adineta steineri]